MSMHYLDKLVSSYFNARSAILRNLEANPVSTMELKDYLQYKKPCTVMAKINNPKKWMSSDLGKLAKMMQISLDPEAILKEISAQIQAMEASKRNQLFRDAYIPKHRRKTLLIDSDRWHLDELHHIKVAASR